MTAVAKLQGGNTKLGVGIFSWSIPARETCPGKSRLCDSRCYAAEGFFRMRNVKESHAANYRFSTTPEFAPWMAGEIRKHNAGVVRLHVAGDFYDPAYVDKWYDIIKACRSTTFYGYTRSWSELDIFPQLARLSSLVNMCLWFSTDREKGMAPRVPGVRIAYMAIDDADAATAPDDCDLVFRDSPDTTMKKANGVLVCPAENGVVGGKMKHTCTSCGLCWDKQRRPFWESLLMPLMGGIDEGIPLLAPDVPCPT
jgi:hypothetical protein